MQIMAREPLDTTNERFIITWLAGNILNVLDTLEKVAYRVKCDSINETVKACNWDDRSWALFLSVQTS